MQVGLQKTFEFSEIYYVLKTITNVAAVVYRVFDQRRFLTHSRKIRNSQVRFVFPNLHLTCQKNNLCSSKTRQTTMHPRGVQSQEMPSTEVPLRWVAIFELRYRDGSLFLPFGIRMGRKFCHQV